MTSAESILHKAAEDGSLDPEEWPQTLKYILDRLDEIVSEFPPPTAPPPDPLSSSSNANTPARPGTVLSSQDSTTADKENAPPATPPRPPVPTFEGTPSGSQSESQSLPSETVTFYSSIRHTLSTNFKKNPPHTIQRLAELVLEPKRRYRFLPSYLRALDRVVSVSSPTTIFPLPQAVLPNAGGLLNGTVSTPPSTLGSDESLGGALLTPIPWLQGRGSQSELISESTEIVEGPNGAGRIETVSVVNGQLQTSTSSPQPQPQSQIASSHPDGESLPSTGPVTQGEILRQEQEAGVVLQNPHSIQPNRIAIGEIDSGPTIMETVEAEEEPPHARGPEAIGMEDTGPQPSTTGHLDIEGAVGRPSIERSSKSPGPAPDAETKDEDMKDGSEAKEKDETPKEDKSEEEAEAKDDEEMKSEA